MIDSGIPVKKCISSFLIESLLSNVPNSYFTDYTSWNETIKNIIIYLYRDSKENYKEVSKILDLFDDTRKWNIDSVNEFLKQMYKFLGFQK